MAKLVLKKAKMHQLMAKMRRVNRIRKARGWIE